MSFVVGFLPNSAIELAKREGAPSGKHIQNEFDPHVSAKENNRAPESRRSLSEAIRHSLSFYSARRDCVEAPSAGLMQTLGLASVVPERRDGRVGDSSRAARKRTSLERAHRCTLRNSYASVIASVIVRSDEQSHFARAALASGRGGIEFLRHVLAHANLRPESSVTVEFHDAMRRNLCTLQLFLRISTSHSCIYTQASNPTLGSDIRALCPFDSASPIGFSLNSVNYTRTRGRKFGSFGRFQIESWLDRLSFGQFR